MRLLISVCVFLVVAENRAKEAESKAKLVLHCFTIIIIQINS